MNTKLNKITADIAKTEEKILALQSKLKVLQKEKTDLENLEMIDFLRKNKTDLQGLQELLTKLNMDHGNVVPITLEENSNETN